MGHSLGGILDSTGESIGFILGIIVGLALSVAILWAMVRLMMAGLSRLFKRKPKPLPQIIQTLSEEYTLESKPFRRWTFSGDRSFGIIYTPKSDSGPENVAIHLLPEAGYPNEFSSPNSKEIQTPLDALPTINFARKTLSLSYTPILPQFNPALLTGDADFDSEFAILSNAPNSFLKTLFDDPEAISLLQPLLSGDLKSSVTLFSVGNPASFRFEGSLNGLTSAFVKEKVEELYALLTILPNFQAKNPAVFSKVSTAGGCLATMAITAAVAGGVILMGAGQRSWQVFDSDFWLKSTVFGVAVALLLSIFLVPIAKRQQRPRNTYFLGTFFLAVIFGLATSPTLRWANATYASAPIETRRAAVVSKRISETDESSYYHVTVDSTDRTPKREFNVGHSTYDRISDSVTLEFQEGALGYLYLRTITPSEDE